MVLDIIVLILIVIGFYSGYSKGLIRTLFAIASILISVAAALKLSPLVADFMADTLNMKPNVAVIIGLIVTFVVFLFFIRFIGNKLESLLTALNINFVNKLAGGVAMALIYSIMVSMMTGVVKDFRLVDESVFTESFTYPIIRPLSNQSAQFIKKTQPRIKEYWIKMMDEMDEFKDNVEPYTKPN